jgi:hypothetical protein
MAQTHQRKTQRGSGAKRDQESAPNATIAMVTTRPPLSNYNDTTYLWLTRQLLPYLLTARVLGSLDRTHPAQWMQLNCHPLGRPLLTKDGGCGLWMAHMLAETALLCTINVALWLW